MDLSSEINVEMAEEELLELLIITEDADLTTEGLHAKEEEHVNMSFEEKQQRDTEDARGKDAGDGQDGHKGTVIKGKPENPSSMEGGNGTQNDPQVDLKRLNSSDGGPDREEDPKKAHRLTPDFPDALYELLCSLQEGRRLNDQRCSFRLETGIGRRRCHSEPNTNKPANRVVFSSMTSLQKEEFFELVATTQARRLDDQRAQLERCPPPKAKGRTFRGSIKQLSFARKPSPSLSPSPSPAPAPAPKQDLYDMILTTQAQGRLEDQRSRAPGPMDDEDFFSLLLRVQGGRMEEQRTELPGMLQT
ncbi:G-protein-signaling modulator 1 [Embiotoca jacksoni]|uniref:G-protein-signaling modulator 1 n=1 Tax=Embiotoca jacksoni TaxID=100190 RepID=UPI003704A337